MSINLFAQNDFRFSVNIKPNYQFYVNETKDNLGQKRDAMFYLYASYLGLPSLNVAYKRNKINIETSFRLLSSFTRRNDIPGLCSGELPSARSGFFYSLSGGYQFIKGPIQVIPKIGVFYRDAVEEYIRCIDFPWSHHKTDIIARNELKDFGMVFKLDVNYPFPKKDWKAIGKERYFIGVNGEYNHLTNFVDFYSYGFQFGVNFLHKKEGKRKL